MSGPWWITWPLLMDVLRNQAKLDALIRRRKRIRSVSFDATQDADGDSRQDPSETRP